MVLRMLLIAGKMQHTAFKRVPFPAYFQENGLFCLADGTKPEAGEDADSLGWKGIRGYAAVADSLQVENGV